MKVDLSLDCGVEEISSAAAAAASHPLVAGVARAEFADPSLMALALAAQAVPRIELLAAVAIAPAVTPMQMAYQAATIERLAPGRLILGLGSQVRAHARQRFGVDWRAPVERMREYVAVVREAWRSFTGAIDGPNIRGKYFRLTFLPEVFTPRLPAESKLRIALGGVGPRMTALAGEVADYFFFHSFTSPQYLRDQSLQFLAEGAARDPDGRALPLVAGRAVVVWETSDEDRAASYDRARFELAFHGSTPNYRRVLEHHDLGDLHRYLRRSMLSGRVDNALNAIDEEVLAPFVVQGRPRCIGQQLAERFGGVADRVAIDVPSSWRTSHEFHGLLDDLGAGISSQSMTTTTSAEER